MACVLLKAFRKRSRSGSVDIEKVGRPYWNSMHRETIAADYKRIAATLAGSVGRADSRRVDGGGWLTVE